jgi:hypothetical protein
MKLKPMFMAIVMAAVFLVPWPASADDAAPAAAVAPAGATVAPSAIVLPAAAAVDTAVAAAEAPEPTDQELLDAGKKISTSFKTAGILGGLTAICYFLTMLFKRKLFKAWIDKEPKAKWVLPFVSVLTGGLMAAGASAAMGTAAGVTIIAGIGGGMAATGFDQVITAIKGMLS